MSEAGETVLVQAFIAQPPIERLDVRVLVRLARFDQSQLDAVAVCPGRHRLAGELRAVVRPDRRGQSKQQEL